MVSLLNRGGVLAEVFGNGSIKSEVVTGEFLFPLSDAMEEA